MSNEMFVMVLAVICCSLVWCGCVKFTAAERQIIASVPVSPDSKGKWTGTNFTYYGLVLASSQCFAVTIFCVLTGSLGYPLALAVVAATVILAVCVTASRIVASLVERKRNTLTVGGASFVGFIVSPIVISIMNNITPSYIPIMPFLAALAAAYAIGEGIGRLGCISFGCCYGKPLNQCSPFISSLFRRHHFKFDGSLKKAVYEGGLEKQPLVPVQAITSAVNCTAGVVSVYLFLNGYYRISFLVAIVVTQLWRFMSEFVRADYRGKGRLSIYQGMSVVMVFYCIITVLFSGDVLARTASITDGIAGIVNVPYLVFIETLWGSLFFLLGKSGVTGSEISLFIRRERM